jgi:hypothetical protein
MSESTLMANLVGFVLLCILFTFPYKINYPSGT